MTVRFWLGRVLGAPNPQSPALQGLRGCSICKYVYGIEVTFWIHDGGPQWGLGAKLLEAKRDMLLRRVILTLNLYSIK